MSAALAASALLLSACGDAGDQETAEEVASEFSNEIPLSDTFDPEGHFTYSYSVMTPGWDPIASVSGYDFVTLAPVYDRLTWNAPDGSVQPMLATDWEQEEGALLLHLREGVTFSDGEPFNAEAVKVNLERAKGEDSNISAEIAQLDSIEVVDELTVRLKADTGIGALLTSMAERPGMMASPKAIEAGTLATTPVGAGAYTLDSFEAGDTASYVKREGYWDPDVQNVATMDIKLMVDDQTRLNALNSGELDGAVMRPPQVKSAVADGLTVTASESVTYLYLLINSAVEPMDDPKVREALNFAVDRVEIGDGLFEGLCTPQIQPWPSTSFAYDPELGDGLDVWPHDPEKAKELLAEAGVPDGFDLPIVTTNVTYVMQLSEILQAQLGEVGINVTIDPVPTPQVVENFSFAKTAHGNANPYSGSADPHGVASRYLDPKAIYSPGEPVAQEILDLAEAASTPVDPEERAPIYHDMMQAMIDNPTHQIPLCQLKVLSAFNDNVSGFSLSPTGFPDLRGVAVEPEE